MWTVSGWMWVVLCVCLLLFCCIYRGELDINGRRVTCKESATAQRTEMWEQMLPGQKFHMCVSVYQKFKFSVAWRKRVTWQAAVPDKSRLSRRLRGPISLAVLDKGQLVGQSCITRLQCFAVEWCCEGWVQLHNVGMQPLRGAKVKQITSSVGQTGDPPVRDDAFDCDGLWHCKSFGSQSKNDYLGL